VVSLLCLTLTWPQYLPNACHAVLQVLTQNKLVVANLGDSRCVLGELNKPQSLLHCVHSDLVTGHNARTCPAASRDGFLSATGALQSELV
jgi:serine/threonine protein phosphatase PrpC